MSAADRTTRLNELRRELMQERGVQAMGGSTPSPGKIRTLRREIARILTIQNEDKLGIRVAVVTPAKKAAKPKAPKKESTK